MKRLLLLLATATMLALLYILTAIPALAAPNTCVEEPDYRSCSKAQITPSLNEMALFDTKITTSDGGKFHTHDTTHYKPAK